MVIRGDLAVVRPTSAASTHQFIFTPNSLSGPTPRITEHVTRDAVQMGTLNGEKSPVPA